MYKEQQLSPDDYKGLQLLEQLEQTHHLSHDEYVFLLSHQSAFLTQTAAKKAVQQRISVYGTHIYIRGLIEISNYCKNNCLYCGIRRGNHACQRYRLEKEQILECCVEGYQLGFRTFVLQGGEDSYYTDSVLCDILQTIRSQFPDCAITLSLGERSRESYQALYDAGANRYLLRHETADEAHYQSLHPSSMSFSNRMRCLQDLKSIGYQVGCGIMVGSPNQTFDTLAQDLHYIETLQPDMCGIGPFIPHHATPFADAPSGSLELTLFLLSLVRLIKPNLLLPATTALGTLHPQGRELGVLAGANVIMPNLSPSHNRKNYELYDNKFHSGEESAQAVASLQRTMNEIGYEIVSSRGDILSPSSS